MSNRNIKRVSRKLNRKLNRKLRKLGGLGLHKYQKKKTYKKIDELGIPHGLISIEIIQDKLPHKIILHPTKGYRVIGLIKY